MKIDLEIGQTITNKKISDIFGVSPQGGMRKSNANNCLVLISKLKDNLYPDKWDDDVLFYTGMGQKGNQDVNYSQNKTLNESDVNGIDVYLLINIADNQYVYYGQVVLDPDKKILFEKSIDINNDIRNVVVFPLRIKDKKDISKIHDINAKIYGDYSNISKNSKVLKKMSTEKLIKEAAVLYKSTEIKNSKIKETVSVYNRDPKITELARRFANGKCQLCGNNAPFKDKQGKPFLEVHHINWLSMGGADSIENVAAICPNCHRKMHIVQNEQDVEFLLDVANRFVKENGIN